MDPKKRIPWSYFDSFSPPNAKISIIKAFLEIKFSLLECALKFECVLTFLKKCSQFCCTVLLRSSFFLRLQKFGLFYLKFSAEFNELSFNF